MYYLIFNFTMKNKQITVKYIYIKKIQLYIYMQII